MFDETSWEQNVLVTFHWSGTFFICFCGNTDVALNGLYNASNGFILSTWTLSPCEIVKLKLMRYIPRHLFIRILTFPVFAFHQSGLSSFTSILISQPETRQVLPVVFIFKIKYLKMLKIFYRLLISNFSKIFYWSGSAKLFLQKALWISLNFLNISSVLLEFSSEISF